MSMIFTGIFTSASRVDKCETRFPHECRRSGLNDGTIRKRRFVDGDSRLISSPNGMMRKDGLVCQPLDFSSSSSDNH